MKTLIIVVVLILTIVGIVFLRMFIKPPLKKILPDPLEEKREQLILKTLDTITVFEYLISEKKDENLSETLGLWYIALDSLKTPVKEIQKEVLKNSFRVAFQATKNLTEKLPENNKKYLELILKEESQYQNFFTALENREP